MESSYIFKNHNTVQLSIAYSTYARKPWHLKMDQYNSDINREIKRDPFYGCQKKVDKNPVLIFY